MAGQGFQLSARPRPCTSSRTRPSPFIEAISTAIEPHLGVAAAAQALEPFGRLGAPSIVDRLAAHGFGAVETREIELDRVLVDPPTSVPKEILGTTIGAALADPGAPAFESVASEVMAAMESYRAENALHILQHSHLVSAVAGGTTD